MIKVIYNNINNKYNIQYSSNFFLSRFKIKTFENIFYVPFNLIYGLEIYSNIGPLTDLPKKESLQKDVNDPG